MLIWSYAVVIFQLHIVIKATGSNILLCYQGQTQSHTTVYQIMFFSVICLSSCSFTSLFASTKSNYCYKNKNFFDTYIYQRRGMLTFCSTHSNYDWARRRNQLLVCTCWPVHFSTLFYLRLLDNYLMCYFVMCLHQLVSCFLLWNCSIISLDGVPVVFSFKPDSHPMSVSCG